MEAESLELSTEEKEYITEKMRKLIELLRLKRGSQGSGTPLLPDEESVYRSLTHPERGDVAITLIRTAKGGREIFISNRRDPATPFAVMELKDIGYNPGRRTLDGSRVNPDHDGVGVFLASVQDMELFNNPNQARSILFSIQLGLYEPPLISNPVSSAESDLKMKKLDACTTADKWLIYRRNWDMDNRRAPIEKDLFHFQLMYGDYKQPEQEHDLKLTPGHFKQYIGQMIRDIYPPGVKSSLRTDFHADHITKTEECRTIIGVLTDLLRSRMSEGSDAEYMAYLEEIVAYLDDIVTTDPELKQF